MTNQTIRTRHHGTATLQAVENDPQTFVVVRDNGRAIGSVSGNNAAGWFAVSYPGAAPQGFHPTAPAAAARLMAILA